MGADTSMDVGQVDRSCSRWGLFGHYEGAEARAAWMVRWLLRLLSSVPGADVKFGVVL